MRAGIGLLSILLAAAIIFYVAFGGPGTHGGYVPTVVHSGQVANDQASQIAGQGTSGIRVQDSIALEENSPGGELRGLTVTNILPAGPMALAYGLQKGDEITAVGPLRVRDMNNDAEMAKAQVYESYQRNEPIEILRNGQTISINPGTPLAAAHPNLFGKPGATVTGQAPPSAATPSTPAAPASPQDQLNQIQQQITVPTH